MGTPWTVCSVILLLYVVTATLAVHAMDKDEAGQTMIRPKRDADPPKATDQHWNVVTVEHAPYVFTYTKGDTWMFKGFIPDLMADVAKIMGITYTIHLSKDGRYGSYDNATGQWNGMIGEVISGESDLVAAAITMTSQREAHVDFVKPFQNLGLSLLIKKPLVAAGDDLTWTYDFSIFSPLEPAVWGLITLTTVVVALVLWALNRFNPYEYGHRYARGLAGADEAAIFNLPGAFWFVFTTLQWQGYERSPRSLASKLLGVFWFAFVTLTLVTYTAGVVNHLFWASTVHGKDPTQAPIRDLEDLVMSSDYDYGTVKGGSTYKYLTSVAKGKEFDVIRNYLLSEKGQSMLTQTTLEGVAKVRQGKYAFIMESMSAKYYANNPPDGACDLMTAGQPFALRSYGFALQQGSPHVEEFHKAILDMHESGELEYLEQKWWVDASKCWNATRIDKLVREVSSLSLNKPKRVNLTTFWGALLLIAIGVVLSALVCVAEILFFQFRGKFESSNQPRGEQLSDDTRNM